jgi:RNA polymerase sigma factor (sigma-70 family)
MHRSADAPAGGTLTAAGSAPVAQPKDFRLVVRIYNNRLRERREATGLGACAFARSIDMTPSLYCRYETMDESPIDMKVNSGRRKPDAVDQSGIKWKRSARRIAEALKVQPADIFPEAARAIRVSRAERRVDAEEVAGLLAPPSDMSPFALLSAGEERAAIDEMLATLTERERLVLSRRFGLEDGHVQDLVQIGETLGVSHERVRQIEAKALSKLRHPSRAGYLARRAVVQ